jgi:hypothetical protein
MQCDSSPKWRTGGWRTKIDSFVHRDPPPSLQ